MVGMRPKIPQKSNLEYMDEGGAMRAVCVPRMFDVAIFVVFVLLLSSCGGGSGGSLVGGDVTVSAILYLGEPAGAASVSIPFTEEVEETKIINVVLDLNGDGVWAAYLIDGSQQEEWIVQNMPAKVSVIEPDSFTFEVVDPDILSRTSMRGRAILTSGMISEETVWDGTVPASALASKSFIVAGISTEDFGSLFTADSEALGGGATSGEGVLVASSPSLMASSTTASAQTSAGVAVDFCPKDRRNMPDITQKHNECVPTATANSLLWLAEKVGFQDKMPKTRLDLINELKGDLGWTEYGTRTAIPVDNPTGNAYLEGKGKFLTRRNISIETHQVGGRYDANPFESILAEMQKGQDVEIDMEFLDRRTGERKSGHMMTAVCAQVAGGKKRIGFHDPYSPGPSTDWYELNGTKIEKYRYQKISDTHIRFVFAESPPALAQVPTIGVSPAGFAFAHSIGVSACPQEIGTLSVTNTGGGTLAWSASESASWLDISASSGSAPSSIALNFNCNVSGAGSLSSEITITGTDAATLESASNSPVVISVTGDVQ